MKLLFTLLKIKKNTLLFYVIIFGVKQVSAQQLDATFSMNGNVLTMTLNQDATFKFSSPYSSSQNAVTIIIKNVYNSAPSTGGVVAATGGIGYTTSTGKIGNILNLGTYSISYGIFIHTTDEQVSFTLPVGATLNANETITFTAGTVLQSSGNYSAGQTFNSGPYTAVIPNSAFSSVIATMVPTISPPTVTTANASNLTATTANLGGNVTANGGANVTERGIVYALTSANTNPTIGATGVVKNTNGNGNGAFSENITGLTASSGYSYRAYAINTQGTSYGITKSFVTANVSPTVTTLVASNLSGTFATLGGNVTANGGANVTERGIVYALTSANTDPTIGGTGVVKYTSGSGIGNFLEVISGLSLNTNYTFKAYAINAEGVSYGATEMFTTLSGDTNSFLQFNGNWSDATSWSLGTVPAPTDNIIIGTGKTVVLNVSNATINNLDINVGATLTILSGKDLTIKGNLTQNGTCNILSDATSNGSLLLDGVYLGSGNVSYLRYVTTNWHLVSSPVSGQDISALSSLVSTSGAKYAIAPYKNNVVSASRWNYYTNSSGSNDILTAGVFQDAKGYAIQKNTVAGTIAFTGTLHTTDKSVLLLDGGDEPNGNRWNLIGNPYTSNLKGNNAADVTHNFLKTNITAGNLDPARSALYFWNGSAYEIKALDDSAFYIAPGQAFFVHAPDGGGTSAIFTENIQVNQAGNTFLKNSTNYPELILVISSTNKTAHTKVRYIENKTTGLDVGSDVGTFSGETTNFEVYTHLVSDNEYENFAIQALPPNNYEAMIIPVGVNAKANTEIKFSLSTSNFPSDLKIYLEDKVANTLTELNNTNNYVINTNAVLNGTGRFYLHTSKESLSVKNRVEKENFSIYQINKNTLKIIGKSKNNISLELFSVIGKQVFSSKFNLDGEEKIVLPQLTRGVYLIQVKTSTEKLHKKIVVK